MGPITASAAPASVAVSVISTATGLLTSCRIRSLMFSGMTSSRGTALVPAVGVPAVRVPAVGVPAVRVPRIRVCAEHRGGGRTRRRRRGDALVRGAGRSCEGNRRGDVERPPAPTRQGASRLYEHRFDLVRGPLGVLLEQQS